ncbi:MAG: hypothetical protein CMN28_09060 [Salinisphaeraceae bacterium]|nr:hypothetical protein [Salinisphaeraceae bacterium]
MAAQRKYHTPAIQRSSSMTTDHHRGFRSHVRRLRRGLRTHLSRRAARWLGTRTSRSAPLPAPQRILVCRLNKRIGNVLFLTPLLQSLAASFPRAHIDVLVRDPAHAVLLSGLPNIDQVYTLPRKPLAILKFIFALRRVRHDLAIDPMVHSESDRSAVLLSGARHRLGFAAEHQWLKLSHAALPDATVRHEGLKPLALLHETIEGHSCELVRTLSVRPSGAARDRAANILARADIDASRSPTLAFFTEATGKKRLPAAWWQAWVGAVREARPDIQLVQVIAPGNRASTLRPDIAGLAARELDVLAAALARMDGFVAADSGPMHLAAAAGTRVLGVFSHTSAAVYGPLAAGGQAIHADEGPEAAARAAIAMITSTVD